jgi:phage portal protein BeeE
MLWLMPPQFVSLVLGLDWRRRIQAYKFSNLGTSIDLPPAEVIDFRMPDLFDPYTNGKGPLEAAIGRQRLANAHLVQAQALLENRARPDAIISPSTPDMPIGRSEAKRINRAFSRQFQGAGAGGLFVSSTGLKLDPITFSPRDMGDLAETRATCDEIARAFGVPLAMLDKDANRANSVEAREQHAKDAIWPRLIPMQDQMNNRVMPMYDPTGRLFVAYDDPVPRNQELAAKLRGMNLGMGYTTVNEERTEDKRTTVPWGDEPWMNGSMRQPSMLAKAAATPAASISTGIAT